MRILEGIVFTAMVVPPLHGQSGWPAYGNDQTGQRYSTLTQIDARNVSKLKLAWQYGIDAAGVDSSPANRQPSASEIIRNSLRILARPGQLRPYRSCCRWRADGDRESVDRVFPERGLGLS